MPAGKEHGGRERSARLQVARTGISAPRAQRGKSAGFTSSARASPLPGACTRFERWQRCSMTRRNVR
jgi:hypothetical protein